MLWDYVAFSDSWQRVIFERHEHKLYLHEYGYERWYILTTARGQTILVHKVICEWLTIPHLTGSQRLRRHYLPPVLDTRPGFRLTR